MDFIYQTCLAQFSPNIYLGCWLQPNPLSLSLDPLSDNGSGLVECPYNLGSSTPKVIALLFSTKVHSLVHRPYANVKRLRFRILGLYSLYISST
jgi:hypothetical protein